MRLDRVSWCFTLVAACGIPAAVGAQGFGLNEIGTCAVGRAQATTGAPCTDASVVYWNPGAATMLKGWSVYAGVAAISVDGGFTADTTSGFFPGTVPTAYPPHVFVNYGGNRWALGLGAYVPYGLTSEWGSDFPGRFSAKKASLQSVYVQPNIAFDVIPGRLSIGGGPVLGYSRVELVQAIDLAAQPAPIPGLPPGTTFALLGIRPGTEFAQARLKGNTTAWGFDVGVHAQLTRDIQVGARYLSKLDFKYDGADATFQQISTGLVVPADIVDPSTGTVIVPAGTKVDALVAPEFAAGGPLVPQTVSTNIAHPAQFQAGIGYSGIPNTLLSADYVWVGWSSFDKLPVSFQGPAASNSRVLIEDYDNSWGIRTGAQYTFTTGWEGRVGFNYAKTPAPDVTVTPLLPDMNRYDWTLGLSIPIAKRYAVDAGYLRVETKGRRGRLAERTAVNNNVPDILAGSGGVPPNVGFYTLNANIFSLSLKANF
ncbi:MAG TPA: outer membrane protein transport protein [Gemmatimonadaceae bacterium]|jgi:long-chain fatty acid transport protein|nr:outer membrane protein transport protein [Gemmatimonadaceae bacterium]